MVGPNERTTTVLQGNSWPTDALAAWPDLWRSFPGWHAFGLRAWTEAWAGVRGPELRLFSPVVRTRGRIIGILPLVLDDDGVLRFHGRPDSDYNDLIADPAEAPQVLADALRALLRTPGWLRIELDNVRADGLLPAALEQLPADLRRLASVEPQAVCPAIVAAPGDLAALAAKGKLRQYHRKLERLGEVRFRHLESRDEIHAHLPAFFRQHQERSVLAGRDSQFLDERPRRFYAALADRMDPAAELRFGILTTGDRIAACHFGFEANGRFIFYKPTFDVDLWDYSPGQVLLRALFEYAEAKQLAVFDFTIGDEDYKHRFANTVGGTVRVTIAASMARAHVEQARRAVLDRVRAAPALHGALRRARRAWRRPAAAESTANAPLLAYAARRHARLPAGLSLTRGGLADLAGLSLAHPAAFPAESIASRRPRLKQGDDLCIGRRGDQIVAVGWTGRREAAALWPESPACALVYDCWAGSDEDVEAWIGVLLGDNDPIFVLAERDSTVGRVCAELDWPVAGRVSAGPEIS